MLANLSKREFCVTAESNISPDHLRAYGSGAGAFSGIADGIIWRCYERELEAGRLTPDPGQREVVEALQRLAADLLAWEGSLAQTKTAGGFAGRWFRSWISPRAPARTAEASVDTPKGVYLWGGVGRGKTHLVDLFVRCLPVERKLRLHFHRFMELVHQSLAVLEGEVEPLHAVADDFAAETDLLVLDELLVADITDAMILGELFKQLVARNVVLVFTSNTPPDDLYRDGLQRSRFLPAIETLKRHTEVVELQGDHDYRQHLLKQCEYYLHDSEPATLNTRLEAYFHTLSAVETHEDRREVFINGREIPVVMWADGILWCTFDQLCATPRSVGDYIKIATLFHTLILGEVPVLTREEDDAARRFVSLVDELYERGTRLIVAAAAPPQALYQGGRLAFEFERTESRLLEMQSDRCGTTGG